MNKYFVVIPVYNEQKHIERCLKQIQSCWRQIIVVDDGSTDRTPVILKRFRSVKVVTLSQNSGKGAAMLAGAKLAWKLKAKGVIFMDGDNQHNPKHIKEFIRILEKGAHIVIGIRLLRTNIPTHRKLGNKLIAFAMQRMFYLKIPDIMCGFRAMTKKGFEQVKWSTSGYGVETEMLTKIGNKRLKYSTLVVDTIYHDRYKGFSMKDGIKILVKLPIWKWSQK